MKVVASFLSNTLFNFIIGLLLAKFLGPEDYGRFAVALGVAVMIQTVAFDWARLAAARFYSAAARSADPALRATLDWSFAVIVLLLGAGGALLLLSGVTASMSPALAGLAIVAAVANGVFDYSTALARARFEDGIYARLIVGKNVLSMGLTVGGAWWFGSAAMALLGLTLSMAGAVASVARSLADPQARPGLASRRRAGSLFRYALPVVLANLFYQSIPLADRLLIARLHGLAESGEFSFAYDIGVRIVAAIGSMLDVLLFQIAVRAHEVEGVEQGRRRVADNIGIVVAVLLPACVGCWLVLPSFVDLVVPAEFRATFAPTLSMLLPGLFCYGLIFFALHPLFQISTSTGVLVAVAFGASLVNLLGLGLAAPGSMAGFAIMQGVAMAFAAAALIVAALATRPVWPKPRDIVGALLGTGMMAWAVAGLVRREPGAGTLVLQVALGVAVYAATALLINLCGARTLLAAALRERRVSTAPGSKP